MSLTIPAFEHGQIRVFSVTASAPPGLLDKAPDALEQMLGTSALDADFIDVFDTKSLDEMTVADFLRHGYDVSPDAADLAMLNGLSGVVILVMSRAAGGKEITLNPAGGVNHVTTVGDKAQLTINEPLESQSTQGVIPETGGKPAKSDARTGGMIATLALVVMMLLVAMMVWIGG